MQSTVTQSTVAEAFARLDRSRATLCGAVDAVPAALRDYPPGPDRWSVANVLEHLSLVDERCMANLAPKIADACASGLGLDDAGAAILSTELEVKIVDRAERRAAPDPLHPSGLAYAAAWERAQAARAAFRTLVTTAAAGGVALSRVIHEHPRFGALSVYQWARFLAAHEMRHAEQIREIASQLAAVKISPQG